MNSKIPPPFKRSALASAPQPQPAGELLGDAQTAAAGDGKTSSSDAAASAPAPPMSGEGLMKRLRYFENLSEQYEHYIDTLKAAITRQGGAVPTGYFAPLKGEGGSYTPRA